MDVCIFYPYIAGICGALFFKFVPMPSWMSKSFEGSDSISVGTAIWLCVILGLHVISLSASACIVLICQFLAAMFMYGLAIAHMGDAAVWAAMAGMFLPTILSSLTTS